jgi:hypothetical protein
VRPDVRSAVARRVKDAQLAAADHYRDALAADAPEVRRYLLAAAAVDRLLSVRRSLRALPGSRAELADAAAARAAGRGDRLVLERAAVGGTARVSLSLSGPAALCSTVDALTLNPVDGDRPHPVAAVVRADGMSVRIAADLPAELFAGPVSRYRIAVVGGDGELPVVLASRSAILRRWNADDDRPLRLALTSDRRLTVAGRLDGAAGVDHAVTAGLTTATVSWTGPTPTVRCTTAAGESVEMTGHRDPAGRCTVTLDLLPLADRPAAAWALSVEDVDGRWSPLALPPGAYPPMAAAPALTAAPLRRSDATTVQIRLAYRRANRLTIEITGRG